MSRWVLRVCKAVEAFLASTHRSKAVTRIAHARLLAVAVELSEFSETEKKRILRNWEKISFRVFGLCRKDARTQVGEYVRLAWDCLNASIPASEVDQRLSEIGSDDREHGIDWGLETSRKTNCYAGWEEELRYLMYRYDEDHAPGRLTNEQWHRIWEESPSHTIEHIQPQSSDMKSVHWLGNLMLLPPGMNSSLSDKKPIEKVLEYRSTGLYAAVEVAGMIEAGGWKNAQIEARERIIIEWVRKTWS